MSETATRVRNAKEVIGHPQARERPVEEGEHYTVLAYTDWADAFIPTVVAWDVGQEEPEFDRFEDKQESLELRERALAAHETDE